MEIRHRYRWLIYLVTAAAAAIASGPATIIAVDKFEIVRAHIQEWISKERFDGVLISPLDLKSRIVDDWARQKEKFQIVSVRNPDDYEKAGHIPYAINIYWTEIVNDDNLRRLDPHKIQILYCYYGHGSMISLAMLELLGYECRSLNFGMMGWNLEALVKDPWDQQADHTIETVTNAAKEQYALPILRSTQTHVHEIIKEAARNYLSGEGSPIIQSSDVEAIIEDWDNRKVEYQIVDVRSKREYERGHVPHAVHIPWERITEIENLRKLAPQKSLILYSANGQTGQLATTALCLLGYRAVNMKFGMMDWNTRCVEASDLWKGAAGLPVDRLPREPGSNPWK